MTKSEVPTLAEVMAHAVETRLSRVNTFLPGVVLSYDAERQEASVQPQVMTSYLDEQELRQTQIPNIINHVPVVFPGSGGWRMKWPVRRGDYVLLLFSSRPIDRWTQRGGLVDPKDNRHHDLSDAIAIPGLLPFSDVDPAEGGATIEFTEGNQIHAGGTDALAKQSDLQTLRNHVAGLLVGGTGSATVLCPGVGSGTQTLKGG